MYVCMYVCMACMVGHTYGRVVVVTESSITTPCIVGTRTHMHTFTHQAADITVLTNQKAENTFQATKVANTPLLIRKALESNLTHINPDHQPNKTDDKHSRTYQHKPPVFIQTEGRKISLFFSFYSVNHCEHLYFVWGGL